MEKLSNCRKRYKRYTRSVHQIARCFLIGVFAMVTPGSAQISSSAYRTLGQSDLIRNGLNRVQGTELFAPGAIALDTRGGAGRLYIADTGNHRVLGWADVDSYQAGDPPSVVLGQFSAADSSPLGTGVSGLTSPMGIAADPSTGALYVADTGNNRVLRFADPFGDSSRLEAEAVYG